MYVLEYLAVLFACLNFLAWCISVHFVLRRRARVTLNASDGGRVAGMPLTAAEQRARRRAVANTTAKRAVKRADTVKRAARRANIDGADDAFAAEASDDARSPAASLALTVERSFRLFSRLRGSLFACCLNLVADQSTRVHVRRFSSSPTRVHVYT